MLLACLVAPVTAVGQEPFRELLDAAIAMRDKAPAPNAEAAQREQRLQPRLWLSRLLAEGEPAFKGWYSERRTFAAAASVTATYPFPDAPAASGTATTAHGSHGGPLIHFTHFNAAAYHHIRDARLYDHGVIRSTIAGGGTLPLPPKDAMVALTGWWPLAGEQATPIPLWDPGAPMRPTGSNGYLNWSRVGLIAPAGSAAAPGREAVHQFAGRAISDPGAIPRDAFYRIKPSSAHVQALMKNPEFRRAAIIVLGRPMKAGDELALVAFHLLHLGLDEGLWLTYWWDAQWHGGESGNSAGASLPPPWHNYQGDMTFSPVHPREVDGSPNICFNPWFDAIFPDSGQGNGLKANCLSCHLRAGIPAAGRLQVTRGRPDIEQDEDTIIYTHLLWSLANPRRSGSGDGHR
ncbi:MAG TPA: hypothetical protein VIC02_05835 [Kineobactrum sp.]